jgi:hypothetical protein
MDALDHDLDFDDSHLDQLPQSTLQNLELNAISSTQREVAARRQRQFQQTTKPLRLTRPSLPPVTAPTLTPTSFNVPKSPESDYGLDDNDDEEVLDLNADTTVYQPYAQSTKNNAYNLPAEPIVIDDAPPNYDQLDYANPVLQPTNTTDVDVNIRKVRISPCP